jgi:hypothetical protein
MAKEQVFKCKCTANCGTIITVHNGAGWFQSATVPKERIQRYSWLWVNEKHSVSDQTYKFLLSHLPQ